MIDQPNILFVHTDEQRVDTLGCYGNDVVDTPHIDVLAAAGVTFEEGHCTHPLCSPSRASLMTGRYPSTHGLWRNGIPLPQDEETLAELLRGAGYTTGLLGKAHFTPYHGDPDEHPESVYLGAVDEEECWDFWREFERSYYGFDHVRMTVAHGEAGVQGGHYGRWLHEEHPDSVPLFFQERAIDPTNQRYNSWKSAAPVEHHSTTWVADRTIEFVDKHAGEQPFFGWVGIPDPHFPYDPPAPYCYKYDPDDVTLPVDSEGEVWDDDTPQYIRYHLNEKYGIDWREIPEEIQREMIAHYWAMVDLIDDQVGRILGALDKRGIADETIVVFTSDHGDWLGDHGLFQKGLPHTRDLTRIPWIVRWPGVAEPGRRIAEPTSQVDLMPTLLDAAGVDTPYGVQGESLRPVLTGDEERTRPFALVEHRHEAFRPDSALVRNATSNEVPEMQDVQDNIVNWGDQDIDVKTIYSDDHRLSYVTGIDDDYGELFDHRTDPGEMDNRWHSDPERRADLMPRLVEALIHADDPLPERKYPV
jgi:arylsulfatase A-like enzyme